MDDVGRAEELFARVADDHGLDGWRLHWCGDPWCQFDTKTLHVKDFGDTDKTMQSLLHEAAHALVGRGGHGPEFWALLKMMVWHYSSCYADPVSLNDHQMAMMHDYLASPAQGRGEGEDG